MQVALVDCVPEARAVEKISLCVDKGSGGTQTSILGARCNLATPAFKMMLPHPIRGHKMSKAFSLDAVTTCCAEGNEDNRRPTDRIRDGFVRAASTPGGISPSEDGNIAWSKALSSIRISNHAFGPWTTELFPCKAKPAFM